MWNFSRVSCAVVCFLAIPVTASACGVERAKVKNLADAQAADAYANPIKQLTVADLAAMPPRPKNVLLLYGDKRFPEEMFHVRVTAILVGFKLESDEDYHVVIADPEDRSKTMIVEIPSPDCITLDLRTQMQALRDAFDAAFGKPTGKYKKARPGVTVSVEGILFRDFAHGQTGAAPSQTEIHPVLALSRVPVVLPANSAMAKLECDGICSNPCQTRCFERAHCPAAER